MKKTKRSLLIGIAAMGLVAASAGAVSTFAWYQANNQASVKGSAANATLATSTTSLAAGAYTLNFHIYSGASGTSTSFSVQLSNNNGGQLERGIYNSSGSAVQKENVAAGTVSTVVQQLRVEATWDVTPTDAADIAYLKGKTITGATLSAAGNAKLLASTSEFSGVTDYTSAAITVTVGASDVTSLTVTLANSICAMRIATNNAAGKEYVTAAELEAAGGTAYGQTAENTNGSAVYHTTDAISIAAVDPLTVA